MPSWKEMTSKPREVREEVKEEVEVEKKPDDLESAIEETIRKYRGESEENSVEYVRKKAADMLASGEDIEKVREFLSSWDEMIPAGKGVTSNPGSPKNPGRKIGESEKYNFKELGFEED